MGDRVERQSEGAELLFLLLPEGASDFTALAMMDTPAETVPQFGVVELGQTVLEHLAG